MNFGFDDAAYNQLIATLEQLCRVVDQSIVENGIPLHDRKAVVDIYREVAAGLVDEIENRPTPAHYGLQ